MTTRGNQAVQRTTGKVIGTIGPRSVPGGHAISWNDRELDWFPTVVVSRQQDTFVVEVELPGLAQDDVSVKITAEQLVIEGVRLGAADDTSVGYQRRDRADRFKRTIVLPDGVDTLRASARFSDGVLEIGMPVARVAAVARPLKLG